jgi:hypothetical protein
MGASFVGNPVHAVLYPPNLLYRYLPAIDAFRALMVFHLMMLPLGWYLVFREIGVRRFSAIMSATMILTSGVVWSEHMRGQIMSTALSGYIVFALLRCHARGQLSYGLVAGVFAGLAFLAGDPLLAGIGFFIGAGTSLAFAEVKPSIRCMLSACLAYFTAMIVVALPVLSEGASIFPLTARSLGFALRESMSYSTPPSRILDFFLPGLLPQQHEASYPWLDHRFGIATQWWYASIAAGPLYFIAYVIAVARVNDRSAGRYLLWLILPVAGFGVLSLGRYFPGISWFWSALPPLKYIRFPERMLRYMFLFSLPIFARGLELLQANVQAKVKRRLLRSDFLWVLVVLIFCFYNMSTFPDPIQTTRKSLDIPPSLANLSADQKATRVLICRAVIWDNRQYTVSSKFDVRFWKIPILLGVDADETAFMKAFSCEWGLDPQILRLLGVSHVITADMGSQANAFGRRLGSTFTSSDVERGFSIFTIGGSGPLHATLLHPKIFAPFFSSIDIFMHSTPAIKATDGLERLRSAQPAIDPYFYLDESGKMLASNLTLHPMLPLGNYLLCARSSTLTDIPLTLTGGKITAKIRANCSGVAAIPFAFLPGWRATINDQPQKIFRLEHGTLAIPVARGDNMLRLTYEPIGLPLKIIASLLMIILGGGSPMFLKLASTRGKTE